MKRTLEEYKAQAMLLGMIYDEQINTFYMLEPKGFGAIASEVDADTMEPLDPQEINRRYIDSEQKDHIASYDDFAPSGRLP